MSERDRARRRAACAACAVLRVRYPEEFDQVRAQLAASDPNLTFDNAYGRATRKLGAAHRDEYQELYRQFAPTPKVCKPAPKPRGPKPRNDIDPLDAVILLNRGMTVKEIAEYDGCSQKAVVDVLTPILARRRSPAAAWYDMSNPKMAEAEIATALGRARPSRAQVSA